MFSMGRLALWFWNWDLSLIHLATLVLKCQTLSLLTFIIHTLYRVGLLNGLLPQWKKQHDASQTQSLAFCNDFILTEFPSAIHSGVNIQKNCLFRLHKRYAHRNELQTGKQNTRKIKWKYECNKAMTIINSTLSPGIKAALCAGSDPQLKAIFISRTFCPSSASHQDSRALISLLIHLQAREEITHQHQQIALIFKSSLKQWTSIWSSIWISESFCHFYSVFWMNESFWHNWTLHYILSESVLNHWIFLSWPRFHTKIQIYKTVAAKALIMSIIFC